MATMKVLVTDGDQRSALAIVRSLGRRGISVTVGAERDRSLAGTSKYCARRVTYPSPYREPEAFEEFLHDFVRGSTIDVVLPVSEVCTRLVARNHAVLSRHCALAAPAFESFEAMADKTFVHRRASQCGVPIPRTLFVKGLDNLEDLLPQVQYPAVVKPSRSRIRTNDGWAPAVVQYAYSEADLRRLYETVEYLTDHPSLIQQRIVGPGTAIFLLCDRGQPRAAFAHRRLRERPPSGGVSVLSESVALDPDLVDHAVRLLRPLAWHGVAMAEFKRDAATGQPYLMEINGRFWGSLQLAVSAGVDFPYLNYQLALGLPLDIPEHYRIGVTNRWLLGDFDHLWMRLLHRTRDQDLPPGSPSRARTVIDFFKFGGRRRSYDVTSRDDLRPFLHELREYGGQLLSSVRRRVRRVFVPAPADLPDKRHEHVGAH